MIKSNQQTQPYYFKEGCYITELWNEKQDQDVSIASVVLPASQRTRPHYLQNTTERYLITEGSGRVYLGDDDKGIDVQPGDVVLIKPGQTQSIENLSVNDALKFLAICHPRFSEVNYFEP
jgi:mannose-6-phosphate isomerase-like protein (cupin superfamily)